jgi:hypothetical protein
MKDDLFSHFFISLTYMWLPNSFQTNLQKFTKVASRTDRIAAKNEGMLATGSGSLKTEQLPFVLRK